LRDVRNKQQLKPKESIKLFIQTENAAVFSSIESILSKQINAQSIEFTQDNISGSFTTVIGKDKFYVVTEQPIDTASQKSDLEKELNHLIGFLATVEKKLGNEKFVQNAKPEVLALEQKKKSDAETKIKVIEESLAILNQ
jgi:valyl-tRNA synthetase